MGYYRPHIALIDCRFYIRESEKEMTCQDIEEGVLSAKRFENEQRKVLYQTEHCRYGCKRCHIAKEIEKLIGN